MSNQRKSWVWQYAERKGDKAYCNVCDEDDENELSCRGGTTGSVLRHLKQVHSINNSSWISLERRNSCDNSSMQNEESTNTSGKETTSVEPSLSTVPSTSDAGRSRKRRRHARNTKEEEHRPCTPDQTERIHQSLAQMVAMNQMPLSFCSSDGFKQFMAIVEPNCKICSEQSVKKRLHSLREAFKTAIKTYLSDAPAVACTSDCWSSRCQESYISMTAHLIDRQWKQKSFTLSVKEIEERHTASNLALCMDTIFHEWGIEDKIIAVVSDNASNITNAIKSLKNVTETADITCAVSRLLLIRH